MIVTHSTSEMVFLEVVKKFFLVIERLFTGRAVLVMHAIHPMLFSCPKGDEIPVAAPTHPMRIMVIAMLIESALMWKVSITTIAVDHLYIETVLNNLTKMMMEQFNSVPLSTKNVTVSPNNDQPQFG
jgi:hypothetical protein